MNSSLAGGARSWWERHRVTVLRAVVVLMAAFALLKLGTEFYRLLWDSSWHGAVDLKLRHTDVHGWFAGRSIYREMRDAGYPPASYAILWPMIGWLEFTPARWLWAACMVAALGWLVWLVVRETGASTRLERVFAALLPLSMNATGVAVGNGQLTLFVLPSLVAGLVLLQSARGRWRRELGGAALVLAALVKPNVAIPFFWLALFVPGTFRPAWLVAAGYVGLTSLAASFQQSGLIPLLRDWTASGVEISRWSAVRWSYGNLHSWAAFGGLEKWNTAASLLLLAALGLWTYRHRHGDLWLLLGVTALAARLWTYHGVYDNVLILLPMVALFRLAKRSPAADGGDVVAGVLLAVTALAMLAPARLLFWPMPWRLFITVGHVIVWIAVLIFLLGRVQQEEHRRARS